MIAAASVQLPSGLYVHSKFECSTSDVGKSRPNEAIDFESALASTPDILLSRSKRRSGQMRTFCTAAKSGRFSGENLPKKAPLAKSYAVTSTVACAPVRLAARPTYC